jgi:hypothetical protein
MAELAKVGVPSLATIEPGYEHQWNGLRAGEALAAGDFVYVKASDGRVYKALGAVLNDESTRARGVVLQAAIAGDGVTILHGVVVYWATALSPGTNLFLSATVAGQLNTVATTGGTTPVAAVVDATRIYVKSAL